MLTSLNDIRVENVATPRFVFYSLKSTIIHSDWRKIKKIFHDTHRSRRRIFKNYSNTL